MLKLETAALGLQKGSIEHNYRENMKLIKKKDTELYNKINSLPSQNDYALYRENENQLYNLISFSRQSTYYQVDNTASDVEKQMAALNLKNAQLMIFMGMGLGYEVIEFVNNIMPSQGTKHILIIEKDPQIFKKALEATLLTDLIASSGVTFLVGEEDITNLFVKLRYYILDDNKFYYAKSLCFGYYNTSINWFKDYFLKAIKAFNEAMSYSIEYYGNCPDDSLIGLTNMLDNAEVIIENPGIKMLYNKFKDKPCVVVSTGPSLNKNKHLLKGLEDKALIIAPDASLKVLDEIGVKPHIVTSLERVSETVAFFEKYKDEETKDIYLGATPVVLKGVYEAYKGPKLIVFRDFNHFRWIGLDKGILVVGKSAGNMAFNIAVAVGCNPIILIGQDLAFADDGTTHANGAIYKGNVYEKIEKNKKENKQAPKLIKVKGNCTDYVLTNENFYSFLKDYEIDVAKYKGRCINCTEGGAYIKGTEIMPFEQAIKKFINKPINPIQIIRQNVSKLDEQQMCKDEEMVYGIIQKAIDEFEQMMELLKNTLENYDQDRDKVYDIIKKGNFEENEEYIEKLLDKFTKAYDMFRAYPAYRDVFLHIIQSYEIQFIINSNSLQGNRTKDNRLETDAKWITELGKWAIVNGEIADMTLKELKKAKKEMTWNCEEFEIELV